MRAGLAGLGAAAALLACGPELPRSVRPVGHGGAEAWPDVAAPMPARHDGRGDAAVIVSVEDYAHLPDRPGAHAVAGAWYRYLHEVRGLPHRRIRWVRDPGGPGAVGAALAKMHWRVRRDATLWLIFIGHAGTPEGGSPILLGPSAGASDWRGGISVEQVLRFAGHGMHRELVAVLDGCLPRGTAHRGRSGLAAPGLPAPPAFVPPRPMTVSEATAALMALVEKTLMRVMVDNAQRGREPSDTVVFTPGVGAHCRERLPGTDTPALSYLLLGALRGWADANRDAMVGAAEALRHTDLLLRAGAHGDPDPPRPQARGTDLTLAREVSERGPALAGVQPPGSQVDEATLRAEAGGEFIDERMKKVDRGRFTMGCVSRRDPACEADERPAQAIFLDSFMIDRYEVTWKDYSACVAGGGCSKIATSRCEVWTGEAFVRGAALAPAFLGEDHPVVCATWQQAVDYCAWMGKRLPTEAEWERAARGPDARSQYPWGDDPPTCAQAHTHECGTTTAPVGQHPAGVSPEGIHDLAGNASEWVADWYDKYAYRRGSRRNPTGPPRGAVRVVRGGSYYDGPGYLRASYRYGLSPQWGYGTVGFRCAR
ncbi:Formylglycine-generating enzyme, required for sulfatase activity, contains SUMF1/FGE domain [Nannocystis exedens]|uniref:Formylglycine-generating enzyme, required for sulfatase activity, contains SUMF1/FGE domain n=1 Tax=Nannocystis exedens TaxID=54 RepID=A0A1I2CBB0_9BACT|nr:SUMF1/EgtB/PvdO family nonheme iron enzyme [Nannocystis exedens]PCC68412.1 Serine/threonine-protein kinase pkn1 [Nannocystis exedens]SFE65455.1 Formylglycine-generating enzyme, required for sulfatase activity, contains SUMF1/FGE domain [Nannocystis exedens]